MTIEAKIVTPVGQLRWVNIAQPGKPDLNGRMRLSASVVFAKGSKELKAIEDQLAAFWEENKPKNAKVLKSNGIKEVKDNPNEVQVNFWTGTHYASSGEERVIKVYNAKGSEVQMGSNKIGNGTIGAISGNIGVYANGPNTGITLYLAAIQIVKFVPYVGSDPGFVTVSEDGFEGFDETPFAAAPMPRL